MSGQADLWAQCSLAMSAASLADGFFTPVRFAFIFFITCPFALLTEVVERPK